MSEPENQLQRPKASESDGSESIPDVTIGALVQFLFGSRPAILALASRRDTFWLGLALVISAGFVREYIRTDLTTKPWVILLPLVATIGISLILFPTVEIVARQRGASRAHFWARYKVFLSLLWMTAPLAWIFILPLESMMSADDAAIMNLWFLGIIMVWRLVLVARILAVLFVPHANEIVFTGTIFMVMLVVDTLSLCNLGGHRFVMMVGNSSNAPVAEFIIINVLSLVTILGVITWPLWLVGTLAVALWQGAPWAWTVKRAQAPRPTSNSIKVLAASSLLIWAVLLPLTQPRLRQRASDQTIPKTAGGDVVMPAGRH